MDKEAQEKIARQLHETSQEILPIKTKWNDLPEGPRVYWLMRATQLLEGLTQLGYCKLPEGEPPLIDEIDMRKAIKDACKFWASTKNEDEHGCLLKNLGDIEHDFIAQAQRDSDIKWMSRNR